MVHLSRMSMIFVFMLLCGLDLLYWFLTVLDRTQARIFVGCPKSGWLPAVRWWPERPQKAKTTLKRGKIWTGQRGAMTRTYSADRWLMIAIFITSMKRQYALHIEGECRFSLFWAPGPAVQFCLAIGSLLKRLKLAFGRGLGPIGPMEKKVLLRAHLKN